MAWDRQLFRGWNAIAWTDNSMSMHIVPELGGRIMNFQLADHPFLWIDATLAGTVPPESRLGSHGEWLNWGGDKIWLAPQGWTSEQQWPGPPDPVIDGGPYHAETLYEDDPLAGLRLTSGGDAGSGVQLSRTLQPEMQSSHLHIVVTMTNVSAIWKQWGIWAVTQIDATNPDGLGWNRKLRAYIPIAANSAPGYMVIYGSENNSQFGTCDGILEARYKHKVGKIGIDCRAGWVAVVDGSKGKVLVQRMSYEAGKQYPDGSNIQIWTNGLGELEAYGRREMMPEDVERNPYLLESELLSPMMRIGPGESAVFSYDWFAATIGVDGEDEHRIIDCSTVACIVDHFTMERDGTMSGHFGVFYEGYAAIEFRAGDDTLIGLQHKIAPVKMTEPFRPRGRVRVPETAVSATLAIYRGVAATLESELDPRLGDLGVVFF